MGDTVSRDHRKINFDNICAKSEPKFSYLIIAFDSRINRNASEFLESSNVRALFCGR
jgi:hypothetical protein